MKRFQLIVIEILLFLLLVPASLMASERMESYWRDSGFVNRFMGSYGFLSEREPSISKEEKEVFDQVVSLMKSDTASAKRLLETALTAESSAALDFTLGNLEFMDGRFGQASSHYESAAKKFPGFQRAWRNLGLSRFREDLPEESLKALLEALRLGDEDGDLYGLIGHLHLLKNRSVSAEAAYRKAMMFAPEEINWKIGLAESLLSQERLREAAALFDELLEQEPDDQRFLLAQADAYLGLDRIEDAAANYELARRRGEVVPAVLANLGDIYLNQGLPVPASRVYLELLGTEDAPMDRVLRAAESLFGADQSAEAAQLVGGVQKKKESLTPSEEAQLRRLQARMAMAEGRDQEAEALLRALVKERPMEGRALLMLASLLSRGKNFIEADDFLKRAEQIEEFEPDALVERAQLLVLQGAYAKAIPLLKDSLVIRPRENVADYLVKVEELARLQQGR